MKKFLDFIKDTPTAFHAANKVKKLLKENGYVELEETSSWEILPGGKYFICRNMSSLIAFSLPEKSPLGFHIAAAHLDSPTFKLKPNATLDKGKYCKLNTEVYGGPIYSTWMDRPLGIAGRIFYQDEKGIVASLIQIDEPVALIPNLPIHYNRNVNKGEELNPQIDMLPILSLAGGLIFSLEELLTKKTGIPSQKILSSDLYLYCLDRGCLAGANKEFIMAPQIDNLECSYGIVSSLLASTPQEYIAVCALFDNEEIGSSTMQGANSTFLSDCLKRISLHLGKTEEEHMMLLGNSFFVSADNAQGFHPNYANKYDETNACHLNQGIVIKNSANGAYTTNAFSSAYFQMLCKKANVSYQLNTNRSDIRGGSTLGALSLTQVSIPSVDIGLAQLAMHSAYETAGTKDLADFICVIKEFFNASKIVIKEEKNK